MVLIFTEMACYLGVAASIPPASIVPLRGRQGCRHPEDMQSPISYVHGAQYHAVESNYNSGVNYILWNTW